MPAQQATNKLLALAAKQRLQIQTLTAARYRAVATERANRNQSQTDAHSPTTGFLVSGNSYTPSRRRRHRGGIRLTSPSARGSAQFPRPGPAAISFHQEAASMGDLKCVADVPHGRCAIVKCERPEIERLEICARIHRALVDAAVGVMPG